TKKKHEVLEPWTAKLKDKSVAYRENQTTRFPILLAGSPDERVIAVVSVAEDITYHRHQQALKEVVELLTHDWVSGSLGVMNRQFKTLLQSAAAGTDPKIAARAAKLLRLIERPGDHPTPEAIRAPGGIAEVSGALLRYAFDEVIPFDF